MTNMEKIKQAGAGCKEGTLEAGVVEILVSIANTSATAAEIIAQDLLVKELNIASAARHLTDYAHKHRNGNSYYMTPETAERLLRDFYKIPDVRETERQSEQESNEIVDLLDFL